MMQDNNNIMNFMAYFNQNIFDSFKMQNHLLDEIKCENNKIIYRDQIIDLNIFRLNELSTESYLLPASEFIELLKLSIEIEKNIENEPTKINYLNILFRKEKLEAEEKNYIKLFMDQYFALKKYENFLTGNRNAVLSNYRQIVNNILYLVDQNSLTEGQKIVSDRVLEESQNVGGRGNNLVRTLKNPNALDVGSEEFDDEGAISKTGFINLILIIYVIINFGIILAISLLKH